MLTYFKYRKLFVSVCCFHSWENYYIITWIQGSQEIIKYIDITQKNLTPTCSSISLTFLPVFKGLSPIITLTVQKFWNCVELITFLKHHPSSYICVLWIPADFRCSSTLLTGVKMERNHQGRKEKYCHWFVGTRLGKFKTFFIRRNQELWELNWLV